MKRNELKFIKVFFLSFFLALLLFEILKLRKNWGKIANSGEKAVLVKEKKERPERKKRKAPPKANLIFSVF